MTKPLVRSFWRFRFYPHASCNVWGWRDPRRHETFDLGRFAYVRKKKA